tara:strand:+ start:869 stop:2053 length:1185 start_codon:yes stop_codon:yes gene_type:complete
MSSYDEVNQDCKPTYETFQKYCHKVTRQSNLLNDTLKILDCKKCDFWCLQNNPSISRLDYLTHLILRSILYKYIEMDIYHDDREFLHLKKYSIIESEFLLNPFCDESTKKYLWGCFNKIQQHYKALNRFAYLWKLKRALVASTTDLFLNEIAVGKQYVFPIFQNGKLFYFTVKDLLTIIRNSLCISDEFFEITPRFPKNPYTNEFFKEVHMTNLYFYIKYNTAMKLPDFLHYWFLKNFCINKLLQEHESILRKYAVRQYVWTAPVTDNSLLMHIYDMLNEHAFCKKKIHIDDNFPVEELVNAFRQYVYVYYINNYCFLDDNANIYYNDILKNALTRFVKYNPTFGRKNIKSNSFTAVKIGSSNDFAFGRKNIVNDDAFFDTYNCKSLPFESFLL